MPRYFFGSMPRWHEPSRTARLKFRQSEGKVSSFITANVILAPIDLRHRGLIAEAFTLVDQFILTAIA